MEEEVDIAFNKEKSDVYDRFITLWMPDYQHVLEIIPRLLNVYCKRSKKVLVAGCGTGNDLTAFVDSNIPWSITGIDPSKEMLEQAKEKLGDAEDLKLIHGYISDLDREKYDAATSVLVMHFLKDDGTKESYLRDLSSRLHKGAALAIVDIYGTEALIDKNLEILKMKLPSFVSQSEIRKRFQNIRDNIYYIPEDRMKNLLLKSGFRDPLKFFDNTIYGGWITRKV